MRKPGLFVFAAMVVLSSPSSVFADDCPCPEKKGPPPPWTGSLGVGVALTGGNTDTTNINVTFNAVYDPKTRNVVKIDSLYLRTTSVGAPTADRISSGIRDEYALSERVFAFGEVRYLRDRFKSIEYLFAPLVGAG